MAYGAAIVPRLLALQDQSLESHGCWPSVRLRTPRTLLRTTCAGNGKRTRNRRNRLQPIVYHECMMREVLNKSAQASPICLCADQGATAKADWPSRQPLPALPYLLRPCSRVDPAQRGAAHRQIGPNNMTCDARVMPRRPAARAAQERKCLEGHGWPREAAARLAQAASLGGATQHDLRAFWTSCRLCRLVQNFPAAA